MGLPCGKRKPKNMTKDEIIIELEAKGIVTQIGESFFITEKYKELLEAQPNRVVLADIPKELNYDRILNTTSNGSEWPVEILESTGRTRATALMNACTIPDVSKKGYRLRGLSTDAINVIGNIVTSKDIDPPTFIDAIQKYYKYTEMPKGFKNLLLDGDVLDIYQEHLSGSFIKSIKKQDGSNNQKWG